jgi:hypothetical protein
MTYAIGLYGPVEEIDRLLFVIWTLCGTSGVRPDTPHTLFIQYE